MAGTAVHAAATEKISVSRASRASMRLMHIRASHTHTREKLVGRVIELGGDPFRGQCHDHEYRDELYGLRDALILNLGHGLNDCRAQPDDGRGQHRR